MTSRTPKKRVCVFERWGGERCHEAPKATGDVSQERFVTLWDSLVLALSSQALSRYQKRRVQRRHIPWVPARCSRWSAQEPPLSVTKSGRSAPWAGRMAQILRLAFDIEFNDAISLIGFYNLVTARSCPRGKICQ